MKLNKRWLRFSLRTFLVLLTLFAVWLGFQVKRARDTRAAIDALEVLGAEIYYVHELKGSGGYNPAREPPGPAWLRELIGNEYFVEVAAINKPKVGFLMEDDDLRHLAGMAKLRSLVIYDKGITDAGLEHLKGLISLRELDLRGPFTSGGLKHLQGLTNLRRLKLYGGRFTNADIKNLEEALPDCNVQLLPRIHIYPHTHASQ